MTKEEREKQIKIEDELDDKLFAVMEAVQTPEKWSVDARTGVIVTVYPHPFLDSWHRVREIDYKPYKYSLAQLPTALLERYKQLQLDIFKANGVDVRKFKKKSVKKSADRKPYVRVTDEMKKEIVRLYNRGNSTTEIAKRVGVSIPTTGKHIRQHNELVKEWAELRELGVTPEEIAKQYNVTRKKVDYHLVKHGYHEHKNRQYPNELIKEWNTLHDSGNTYQEISEVYNVTKGTVMYQIAKYRKDRTINPKPKKEVTA
ncbi:hypothetical protein [Bacillus rhizoplanae]|uniref:hypothetical protein n=1 Tax=Bacillus rhizoplanae TaxID=2880966 RepID=UPI003D1E926D